MRPVVTLARFLDLKKVIERPYRDSVVRRTAILLALVVPAFAANMLVSYGGAALLVPSQFGIFYLANTISNVLFSGSLVLNMVFTRYLVSIEVQCGHDAIFVGLRRLQEVVIGWGAVGALAIFAVLWFFAYRVGVESNLIILLVVLDAYSSYVADLGRILFQSLRRTVPLGLYTLVWMMLRCALCMVGLLVFHTVWGAFIGIVASAIIITLILQAWADRQKVRSRIEVPKVPSILSAWPAFIGYGMTIIISYFDVLLGYFLLNADDLGSYSASSVLPKAIIVIVMPLLQMLFPIAASSHLSGRKSRYILAKSGIVVVAVTGCGAMATRILSSQLCGGAWGINSCDIGTLSILLWSVLPLVLLRGLVLLQFARGLDWIAICLVIPMSLYAYVMLQKPFGPVALANGFVIFSFASLAFLTIAHIAAVFLGGRHAFPS